jgi:hypothetical protein
MVATEQVTPQFYLDLPESPIKVFRMVEVRRIVKSDAVTL